MSRVPTALANAVTIAVVVTGVTITAMVALPLTMAEVAAMAMPLVRAGRTPPAISGSWGIGAGPQDQRGGEATHKPEQDN